MELNTIEREGKDKFTLKFDAIDTETGKRSFKGYAHLAADAALANQFQFGDRIAVDVFPLPKEFTKGKSVISELETMVAASDTPLPAKLNVGEGFKAAEREANEAAVKP